MEMPCLQKTLDGTIVSNLAKTMCKTRGMFALGTEWCIKVRVLSNSEAIIGKGESPLQ